MRRRVDDSRIIARLRLSQFTVEGMVPLGLLADAAPFGLAKLSRHRGTILFTGLHSKKTTRKIPGKLPAMVVTPFYPI